MITEEYFPKRIYLCEGKENSEKYAVIFGDDAMGVLLDSTYFHDNEIVACYSFCRLNKVRRPKGHLQALEIGDEYE